MTKLGLMPLLLASAVAWRAPGTTTASPATLDVSTMTVQIWPEYDDPGVLLIYDGELASTVKTPTVFSFLIPEGARMNMVGGVEANGQHVHADYTTKERADGLTEVTYNLTVPHFYMEFYYDPFTGGARRDFTYSIVSPYHIDSLTVAVQQPRRAQGFMVTPYTREVTQDKDGFLYYVIQHDSVAAGSTEPVSVAYTKQDDKPSVEPKQAGMGGSGGSASRGWGWSTSDIPLYASLLLAAVAGLAFFHSTRTREPWEPSDGDDGPEDPDGYESEGEGAFADGFGHRSRRSPPLGRETRFCTECGASLEPGDRYCGACGRPARAAFSLSANVVRG